MRKNRICMLLLAALVLLSTLPIVSVSAAGKETILSVTAYMSEPRIGRRPDYSIGPPDGAHYTVTVAGWYGKDENGHFTVRLSSDYVFEKGSEYQATIVFTPDNGYEMGAGTEATVNSKPENGKNIRNMGLNDYGQLVVWATFPAFEKKIFSVEADISVPVAGGHPDYTIEFPDGEGYTAEVSNWYAKDRYGNFSTRLRSDYVFRYGVEYQAVVLFTPDYGYKVEEDTKATVNGILENGGSVENIGLNDDGDLIVWATFEAKDEGFLLGDVNADGYIDNLDAALVLGIDSGAVLATPDQEEAGDVNHDGYLDNIDAALILKYDAGDEQAF